MGLLDEFAGIFTGGPGAKATGQAAGVQAEGFEEALRVLQEQLGITRGQFAPFLEAGREALPGVQAASTVGGLDQIINQIMGGEAFGGLVEERQRGIEGTLAAGGLSRSGAAIEEGARIPTDLALQLEQLLTGRKQNLAGTGLTATSAEAGQTGNLTQQIIQAITGGAQATASGILGSQQARTQGIQNLLNLGGTLGAGALQGAFSDPRLKENIKKIGKIGPLDLVRWDWIPELGDSFVKTFPTVGYLSTQVKEIFPHHVSEFGGYDVIDYPELNKELVTWH
jgi:hypothetical protein